MYKQVNGVNVYVTRIVRMSHVWPVN